MPNPSYQAILWVDGYNIVGAWPQLRQTRDREGFEPARRALIESLVGYGAVQHFDIQIVFDAQYQDRPGTQERITPNLSACYTNFRQTADSYIERACARFQQDLRKFDQRLIVSTSDRALQLTVVGYGAEWMSAQQLAHAVEFSDRSVRHKQRTPKRSTNRSLGHALDPAVQARLAKLRFGDSEADAPS